jgi:hypothetical protein
MTALFDMSMPLDYRAFYRQLFDQIVCQDKSIDEIASSALQFTFNIYDVNCDGVVE